MIERHGTGIKRAAGDNTGLRYSLTMMSHNRKTGAIPVSSTSEDSCGSCPLRDAGCYGKAGLSNIHWVQLTARSKGYDLDMFCAHIRTIPPGQLWRHNEVGDLPNLPDAPDTVDPAALKKITKANRKRRGFTFTHKTAPENIPHLLEATRAGFTINLSADNTRQADQLMQTGLPVAVLMPRESSKVSYTPKGNKIVICPNHSNNRIKCATCQLCYKADRPYIIGFPAHGKNWKKAEQLTHKE